MRYVHYENRTACILVVDFESAPFVITYMKVHTFIFTDYYNVLGIFILYLT